MRHFFQLCKEARLVGFQGLAKVEGVETSSYPVAQYKLQRSCREDPSPQEYITTHTAETFFTVYRCYSTGRKGSFDPTREMEKYRGEHPKKIIQSYVD